MTAVHWAGFLSSYAQEDMQLAKRVSKFSCEKHVKLKIVAQIRLMANAFCSASPISSWKISKA